MSEQTTEKLPGTFEFDDSLIPLFDENYAMDWKEFLLNSYLFQTHLNKLAGMPMKYFETRYNLQRALSAEVHEALQELKSSWAWWSDKPVNVERLNEEVIDVWFFTLSIFHLLQNAMSVEFKTPEAKELDLMVLATDRLEELLDTSKNNLFVDDLRDTKLNLDLGGFLNKPHAAEVVHTLELMGIMSAKESDARHGFLTLSVVDDEDEGLQEAVQQSLINPFYQLTVFVKLAFSLQLTPTDLMRLYLRKAKVNLNRWVESGVIAEDSSDLKILRKILTELEGSWGVADE